MKRSNKNITKKIIKTEKLDELLKRCKDDTGKMLKIPVLSSLREVNGEMIWEVESYRKINDDTFLKKKFQPYIRRELNWQAFKKEAKIHSF